MSSTEAFFAFARERHNIYLRRKEGLPKPWTQDEVLRQFKFTNVFRELDATTVWIRENIREPLRDSPLVFQAMLISRWFNRISTLEVVKDIIMSGEWSAEKVDPLLRPLKPIFTNAFMINSPAGTDKLTGILGYIEKILPSIPAKVAQMQKRQHTLQDVTEWLSKFEGLAGFMAYEVVTDLRHTALLENAPDIMTWANPGPGCVEGLKRMMPGENIGGKGFQIALMLDLLEKSRDHANWPAEWPALEMRDIEHTLCEFGKYSKTVAGEGTPKVVFDGGGVRTISYGGGSGRAPRAPADPNEAFIKLKMATDLAALAEAERSVGQFFADAIDDIVEEKGIDQTWLPVIDTILVENMGEIVISPMRAPSIISEQLTPLDWFKMGGESLEKVLEYGQAVERVRAKEQRLRDAIKAMEE